jgi:hypothetical protein
MKVPKKSKKDTKFDKKDSRTNNLGRKKGLVTQTLL